MPDYKQMYLTMFRASEAASRLLIAAQRECEELYLAAPEAQLLVLENAALGEPPAPVPAE